MVQSTLGLASYNHLTSFIKGFHFKQLRNVSVMKNNSSFLEFQL
jgi:hypothetical protein